MSAPPLGRWESDQLVSRAILILSTIAHINAAVISGHEAQPPPLPHSHMTNAAYPTASSSTVKAQQTAAIHKIAPTTRGAERILCGGYYSPEQARHEAKVCNSDESRLFSGLTSDYTETRSPRPCPKLGRLIRGYASWKAHCTSKVPHPRL